MKTTLLLLSLLLAGPLGAAPKSPAKGPSKPTTTKKFTVAQVAAARQAAGFDARAMGLPGIVGVGTGGRSNQDAWIMVMARDQACAQAAAKALGQTLRGIPIRIQVTGAVVAQPTQPAKPQHNQALLNAAKARELRLRVQQIRLFIEAARLTKPAADALQTEIKQLEKQITALVKTGTPKLPNAGGNAPAVSKKFATKHPAGSYAPGQLMLTIAPGAVGERIQRELAKALPGYRVARTLLGGRVLLVQLAPTMNVEQGLKAVQKAKCVRTAELNGIVTIERQLTHGGLQKLRPRP